ncbi:hypothetical protein GN956_G206 [Arapaima gigas]
MGNSSSVTQEVRDDPCDTLPEVEADTSRCPKCPGILRASLNSAGCPLQYTQCSQLPESHLFCRFCLAPWKPIQKDGVEHCSNRSCELVYTLLICDTINNPNSYVHGCPVFRACPQCYCLMMHVDGCNNVTCPSCRHQFCFICLQSSDSHLGFCRKPLASRQRFVT